MNRNNKGRNLAIGGAVVAGVSYLAGILTAPKSGRETRKDINRAAHKAMTEAERKLKLAHSELNVVLEKVEAEIQKGKTKVNEDLQKAIKQAKEAKGKARVIISALHEGEAADHDLDVAVKEVRAAIKHLKTFATK